MEQVRLHNGIVCKKACMSCLHVNFCRTKIDNCYDGFGICDAWRLHDKYKHIGKGKEGTYCGSREELLEKQRIRYTEAIEHLKEYCEKLIAAGRAGEAMSKSCFMEVQKDTLHYINKELAAIRRTKTQEEKKKPRVEITWDNVMQLAAELCTNVVTKDEGPTITYKKKRKAEPKEELPKDRRSNSRMKAWIKYNGSTATIRVKGVIPAVPDDSYGMKRDLRELDNLRERIESLEKCIKSHML